MMVSSPTLKLLEGKSYGMTSPIVKKCSIFQTFLKVLRKENGLKGL